ncbi:MAG: hypothetical protein DRJ32_01860 [Thermoprotei archaeon]|nr:MAG: hypothetical protein DRJ32_01860 [Thermoprotei archaeon]
MKIVVPYSGGKGGVGKSTILSFLGILLSRVRNVLLIDLSSEGGISSIVLGNPEPPYTRDVVESGDLFSAIGEYMVKVSDYEIRFWMVPNRGRIDGSLIPTLSKYYDDLSFFDLILIDLPTFQPGDEKFMEYITNSNTVLMVAEPTLSSVNSLFQDSVEADKIFVLNTPRPFSRNSIKQAIDVFRSRGIDPFFFPFDAAASLASRNFIKAIESLSKPFQESLLKLALKVGGEE